MGGIHRKLPSPTKPSLQKHLFVFPSQAALRPQENESLLHRSLHFPETQESGSGHGTAVEHVSGTQLPPGNGLPLVPSEQAQVAPESDIMHWALRPHIIPRHWEMH